MTKTNCVTCGKNEPTVNGSCRSCWIKTPTMFPSIKADIIRRFSLDSIARNSAVTRVIGKAVR